MADLGQANLTINRTEMKYLHVTTGYYTSTKSTAQVYNSATELIHKLTSEITKHLVVCISARKQVVTTHRFDDDNEAPSEMLFELKDDGSTNLIATI